jgi:hypothetical protein
MKTQKFHFQSQMSTTWLNHIQLFRYRSPYPGTGINTGAYFGTGIKYLFISCTGSSLKVVGNEK